MEKILLKYPEKDSASHREAISKFSRKYRNLYVGFLRRNSPSDWFIGFDIVEDGETFYSTEIRDWSFLNNKPIKCLKMRQFRISEESLIQIFKMFADSLETLEMEFVEITDLLPDRMQTLINFTKLKHFTYAGYFEDFSYFPETLQLETLKVCHCDSAMYYRYSNPNALIAFINKQDKLKTLEFKCSGNEDLPIGEPEETFKDQFNVENLQISSSCCNFFRTTFTSTEFPFVKNLLLDGDGNFMYTYANELSKLVNQMKVLETLDLPFSTGFFESVSLKRINALNTIHDLNGFPHLQQLCNVRLNKSDLKFISDHCQSIKFLESVRFDEKNFEGSLTVPNITTIKFIDFFQVNIENFFTVFLNLEVLEISIWEQINEEDFKTILTHGNNLRVLEIRNGFRLPADIFEKTENLLGNLKILKIYNMREISELSEKILVEAVHLRSFISKELKFEHDLYDILLMEDEEYAETFDIDSD